MVSEPVNAQKYMKVYYTHTVYLIHASSTHVAIFMQVHYKGRYIEILQKFLIHYTDIKLL